MTENINELLEKFIEIKKLGWIKSQRKGTTGIGYTFEKLINKKEENFELPDFKDIEIKTKHKYSKGYVTLFNANPDGEYLFPIKKLQEKYGYPDKDLQDCKVFKGSIKGNMITSIGSYHRFTLKIDHLNNKIMLIIIDNDNQIVDNSVSWSFELLKEKLERKLNLLAIVKAESKFKNENEYLKYTNINFYKLNDFNTFLDLIEKGIIRITFKIGVFKSGPQKGETHNHGTGFDINENNLEMLYKKIS